jgi:hypothetical protein
VRVTEAGWTDSVDFLVGFLGLDDGLIYIYIEDRTKLDGHVTFF